MRQLWRDLSRWFFALGDARTAAVLRIGFCLSSLLIWVDFYPVMPLLFGHAGLFGTFDPYPFNLSGPQHFLFRHDSPWELQVWIWISLLAAFFGIIGLFSRTMVALCFFSMILFNERGPFITFGADLVLHCIGFWLLFLRTGDSWSVDAWRRRRRQPVIQEIEGWPIKAVQIQVALVYFVTGFLKLGTIPWRDGSAVYYSLNVGNVIKEAPPAWLTQHRSLLGLGNYATITIEILSPLLLLYRPARLWAVGALVLLHTVIDCLMSIRFFSLVMYVGLLAFIDRQDWQYCTTRLWALFDSVRYRVQLRMANRAERK
jgi:hypothetical protein